MDFKDPTLTKIKQECEDISEDVPDFVKIESGEIKYLSLDKFESLDSGDVKTESDVKDLPLNKFKTVDVGDVSLRDTVIKQETDIDIKVHSLRDLPLNKVEFVNTEEVDLPNTDIKQEVDIDIKVNSLKSEDCLEETVTGTEKGDGDTNSTHANMPDRCARTCELCGVLCWNTSSYSLHMMDHTTDRPFKCDKCDKAYKEEEQLADHLTTHADSSGSSDSESSSGHHSGSDSELLPRPSTKKKRLHLDEQSKQICLNVYNNLQTQNEVMEIDSVIRETSYLTEIPYSTICKLVREDVTVQKSRSDCGKKKQK